MTPDIFLIVLGASMVGSMLGTTLAAFYTMKKVKEKFSDGLFGGFKND